MTQGQEPGRQGPDLTKSSPTGRMPGTEPLATDPWAAGHWPSYDPAGFSGFRDPLAGLDPTYPPYPYATARPRTNSMASAAMICALISIPATFFCLGALLAPAAVIMGFVGLGQMKNTGETGEAQAWTGIVIGGLMTSFVLMVLLGLALAIG